MAPIPEVQLCEESELSDEGERGHSEDEESEWLPSEESDCDEPDVSSAQGSRIIDVSLLRDHMELTVAHRLECSDPMDFLADERRKQLMSTFASRCSCGWSSEFCNSTTVKLKAKEIAKVHCLLFGRLHGARGVA